MTKANLSWDDVECVACGCCCIDFDPLYDHYAYVSDEDYERIGHPLRNLLVKKARNAYYTRTTGAVCDCLTGIPGQKVSCMIYDRRPAVCSEFQKGSSGCVTARHEQSMESPTALPRAMEV